MFSYKPLLKLPIDKNMTKTQLRIATGMSMATLVKISKDGYVSIETLDKICEILDCEIEDIIKRCK